MLPTIEWQDDEVVMVDQRKLPGQEIYVRCRTANEVAKAIKTMVIRGAPAIGVAAAMGLALGVSKSRRPARKALATEFDKNCDLLAGTRPTAVNLFWAIERMKGVFARVVQGRRVGRRDQSAARDRGHRASMTKTSRAAARSARTAAALVPATAPAS